MTVLTKPKTRTQKQTMYGIHKENFFYNGTYGAPADGLLTDTDEEMTLPETERMYYPDMVIRKFETKTAAEKYLTENNFEPWNKTEWAKSGTYVLSHGEYDRPRYTVKKILI